MLFNFHLKKIQKNKMMRYNLRSKTLRILRIASLKLSMIINNYKQKINNRNNSLLYEIL